MKLLYSLKERELYALKLKPDEAIHYCVPVDLQFDTKTGQTLGSYTANTWLVVTSERFAVLSAGELKVSCFLKDCKKIKCEHQVNCGIITIEDREGNISCKARMSMRHIVRVSYVVRGAQELVDAISEGKPPSEAARVESPEYEKYCEGKTDLLKKFMALCGGYVGKLLLISLIMVLSSIINLINPVVQKNFIDGALASGDGTWLDLAIFVGISLLLLVLGILLAVFRSWNCAKLGASLSMSIRAKMYYKIQVLSLSFINKRKPGELMNRVSRDTNRIRNFMEEVFGDMFSTLLTMFVSLIMMLTISVKMTLMSLVFVILVFVLARGFWHHIRTIYHKQWLKMDDLSSSLQDIISGMRIVKTFGKEERETERFTKKTREYASISKRNETFWACFFPILTFLLGVGTYIAILFGGMDVLEGDMTLGQLVQFITYSGYLFGPLSWMTHLPRSIMEMLTSLNRIYDILDEEPVIADSGESVDLRLEGSFSFKNVSFGYQTYEPVLEDISFDVKPGEMIGLVGASGTGKSTLINLIMRLYDVDRGSITVDGVNIKNIKTDSLHSQLGVVLQETFLFSGSILANIRFARPDASLNEVIQAAKAANAHDFICKTPDGYNTYVGEHGYNLSGGERQRIAIARAILNNPRLLILDEATSALDTESEFLIQQALNRLIKGRTTFAIAHRLSTLRNADRLVVIDKHGIAEIGTHNELLEKKGIYYGLVTAQLKMAEGK